MKTFQNHLEESRKRFSKVMVVTSNNGKVLQFSDGKTTYFVYDYVNLSVGSGWKVSGTLEDGLTPLTKIITNPVIEKVL